MAFSKMVHSPITYNGTKRKPLVYVYVFVQQIVEWNMIFACLFVCFLIALSFLSQLLHHGNILFSLFLYNVAFIVLLVRMLSTLRINE